MDNKHHEFIWVTLGGITIWLIGECIAIYFHAKAMKKFSVCPYAAAINKMNGSDEKGHISPRD
jgi:hypothetical protein